MTDVTGTTALPVSSAGSPVRVWFDVESVSSETQQPQTQQIANFEAKANEDCINGSTVAVNQHFVVYTVKNGLIRVLHRHSTLRTLLRGHQEERVTDCRFFQDGDILATCGHNAEKSTIVVWRVFERPPEVVAEKLLEIVSVKTKITRVLWHPFNPNQFWMIHTNAHGRNMASLVETTKLQQVQAVGGNHGSAVFFKDYTIMNNGITIQSTDASLYDVTDLAWSPLDSRHVLTVHSSGEIVLWDLKTLMPRGDGTLAPTRVQSLTQEPPQPLTRCMFLPHDNKAASSSSANAMTSCFVTASDQNATITLWSPFEMNAKDGSAVKPQKIQVLSLERPSPSYILDVVYSITPPEASPMSSFLIMADRHAGKILAFHLKAQWGEDDATNKKTLLVGSDYVVPFKTRFPTYSWSVQSAPAADITEEELVDQGGLIFDAKLFAYQSKIVQSLTLTSYMLLPPESTWMDPTPGVRLERLFPVQSAHVSVVDEDDAIETAMADFKEEQFEDYDGEEDYGEGNEDKDEGDGVAAVPTGNGDDLATNPFANWLGAIAATSDPAGAPPPLPPVANKPAPPPGISAPVPTPVPPQKKEFAVPVVSAPPASDLPAPSGEPMAFLSPSDFLPGGGKPPIEPTPEKTKQEASGKRSATKSGKKTKKKDQQANNGGGEAQDVSILKRESTPQRESKSKSPKRERSTPSAPVAADQIPDIAKEIRMAVKEEMKMTVVPAIENTIKEALDASVVRPLQASIDSLSQKGVTVDHDKVSASLASSVDPSLRAVFTENMKTVFIPTLESVTGQILEKLSENLAAESNGTASKELVAMSSQLSTMTELVAELTREVHALRSAHTSLQQDAASAPVVSARQAAPEVNQMEAMKAEILRHLREKQFEAAFTRAVSASTAELAVFCCANADVNEVLGVPQIQLSQPIIICLMQQLGTVVATARNSSLQVELEWLQDLAMSLDPKDKTISQHVPRVLQQLVTSINTRVAEGDPNLRRPLQRLLSIVRGIPIA